jgi:outer membrane biosynthesis protein TonB
MGGVEAAPGRTPTRLQTPFVVALSLSLLITAVGGGAEPDAVTSEHGSAVTSAAGYGYEFADDNVLAPPAAAPNEPNGSGESAGGRVRPEVIQSVIRTHAAEIKVCRDAALLRNPAVAGKVAVHFVINPDGSVEGAKDSGSTVQDAAMIQCVIGAVGAIHFAASTAGLITVVYPIVFTP